MFPATNTARPRPVSHGLVSERPFQFEIRKTLGFGGEGQVYLGLEPTTGEEVAIKVNRKSLEREMYFYRRLQGFEGFPRAYGLYANPMHSLLTMEYLGPDLLKLSSKKRLSLKSVLMIGMQLVDRLEVLHEQGIIHRDIKPHNIAIGRGENSRLLYLFDLGLAQNYLTPSGQHKPNSREVLIPNGTPYFMSYNVHNCVDASRRDDMEAVGYTLIYLLKGKLPWDAVSGKYTK